MSNAACACTCSGHPYQQTKCIGDATGAHKEEQNLLYTGAAAAPASFGVVVVAAAAAAPAIVVVDTAHRAGVVVVEEEEQRQQTLQASFTNVADKRPNSLFVIPPLA